MTLRIGVDGGGTKTRVVILDEAGAQRAEVTVGPSAIRTGGVDDAAEVILNGVREALEQLGEDAPRARLLSVGVAGAGRPREASALRDALRRDGIADEVQVHPDFETAMEDAFGDGPGVLLISGTGSACFGRGPSGAFARCGGWGPFVGDEGSGAWIGRRSLSVIAASHDGREPMTALEGAILTSLQIDEFDQLLPWAAAATPAQLAQLATPVMMVAATGDLRANTLLAMAAEELVLHVRTLARQLFVDERADVPVALAGGLLQRGTLLRSLVERRLKSAVPGGHVRHDPVDAARGAITLARRLSAAKR